MSEIVTIRRFRGGWSWMIGALVAFAIGGLLTLAGWFLDPHQAAFSWMLGFAWAAGIVVATLILLGIFHAAKARWMTVLRRTLEVTGATAWVLLLAALPLLAGLDPLYEWIHPPAGMPHHEMEVLEHKQEIWLNVPFFLLRTAIYLVIWIAIAELLLRWSRRQDVAQAERFDLILRQRRFAGPALPILAVSMTFAGIDWLMSMHPLWHSTMFGVYYFAGSFVAAIALVIVVLHLWRGPESPSRHLGAAHWHSLGKLLHGFVVFWAYIAFCQYMLIWVANLPEEAPWYLLRQESGWKWVAVFLIVGHFVLPFAVLLFRAVKRDPRRLVWVAAWILVVHFVDVYWVVLPVLHEEGPAFHWLDLTAPACIAGALIAFAIWRQRGSYAIPVGDPYLPESLRYRA